MFAILITDSAGETHIHPIAQEAGRSYTLGRSEECDIALPAEVHLSRVHCLLTVHENQVYLQDNNSSNGIFIGSRRIEAEYLVPEREYTLGLCTLILIRTQATADETDDVFRFDDDESNEAESGDDAAVSSEEEALPPATAEEEAPRPEPAADAPQEEQEPAVQVEAQLPRADEPHTEEPCEIPAPEDEAPPAPAEDPVHWEGLPPATVIPAGRLRPKCSKAAPRPLKGVHQPTTPPRPRPKPKQLRTIGRAEGTTKKLHKPSEHVGPRVRYAPGISGEAFGLPADFELRLRLLNSTAELPVGTPLHFGVAASQDCYFYLAQYDCEGNATLLVPGIAGEDNKVFANTEAQFPRAYGNEYELIVESPLGKETLIGIACSEPVDFERNWHKILATNTAQPVTAEQRAINLCNRERAQWASALLYITTG